jgi:hypothetical protein
MTEFDLVPNKFATAELGMGHHAHCEPRMGLFGMDNTKE